MAGKDGTTHDTSRGSADDAAAPKEQAIAHDDKVHGEGNYEATRDYNRDTKAFIDAGKVDDAARRAAPESEAQAKDLKQAEAQGAKRAKH